MKRRSFFKNVAVGVATFFVNPKSLLARPQKIPLPVKRDQCPILLSWMREVYCQLSYGSKYPTLIRVSPRTFDEILMKFPYESRYLNVERVGYIKSLRFKDADVVPEDWMPDTRMWFINEKYPESYCLNRLALIGERIWFDAQGKEHREMMNA